MSAGSQETAQSLQLSKLAASIVSKKLAAEKPGQAKHAASDVRIRTLLALLARTVGEVPVTRAHHTLRRVQPLFLELLDVWEVATAAEAVKAATEAETFTTKIRETNFKTEEVGFCWLFSV